MSIRRVIVALGLVACSSCAFDSSVPPDASIACAGSDECPPGWACQGTVGQCVPSTQLDGQAPGVLASSVVVQIRPLVGNRLANPQALGSLGEGVVSFTVSEPLSSAPVLSTSCGLDCTRQRDDITSFAFSCRTTAQVTDGACELTVRLVDLALNAADVPLPSLRVDVTAPPPPPTDEADTVVYHRSPHGAVATAGVPEWHVSIRQALVDAVALVARSGAFERALADLDGGVPGNVPLLALDSPSLEVAAIDAAGNPSDWARVRDGRWIASPGGSGTSPHRLELVGALGPLARADVVTRGAADGLANVDGLGASVGGAASWSMANLGPPLAAKNGAIAVDLGRSRVVRWGGDTPSVFSFIFGGVESVCEWRGEGWQCAIGEDPESDGNPEPRASPVLVYDETRRRILMHGGRSSNGELMSDTWAWNGHSWTRLAQGPAVARAVAFWDTPRRRLVLFGGTVDAGVTDKGWTFDGTTWSALPETGPSPRRGAALAFDRRTGTAWLFGGGTQADVLADTWRYDGASWSQVDAGAGPEARVNGQFAWDFDRGEGLLWGGQQADGGWRQDAWWWNGAQWSQRGDGGLPSYRFGGDTLAYEPWARRFVSSSMFAQGMWATEITSDSWVVKDGVASLVPTPTSPAPASLRPGLTCRGPLGCVVLNESGRLVKFGEGGFEPLFGPDAGLPSVTGVSHRLAWDSSRARYVATVVTFDGGTGTWELTQDAGAWSWQNRGAPSAQGMYFLADVGNEVVCPSAGRLTRVGDVSAWTGASWRPMGPVPAPASPTLYSSLTGTERRDGGLWALVSTVLPFQQLLYEVVDGGTWLPPGGEVAPIAAGMLAEDPVRGRLVAAHGVVRSSTPSASTYERTGPGQWVQLPESDPEGDGRPSGRVGGAMGWEPRTRSLLAFGGSPEIELTGNEIVLTDAWRLQVSPHRPASVFRASLDELQLEPGAEVLSLEVRATAGGTGQADGGTLNGASLVLWSAGRWEDQGVEHGQGLDQAGPLTLRVAASQRLDNLVTGQPDLNAAVVTRGANGTDFARLFVDAVEMEVSYRLPR